LFVCIVDEAQGRVLPPPITTGSISPPIAPPPLPTMDYFPLLSHMKRLLEGEVTLSFLML